MVGRFLVAAVLCPFAFAFSDSVPLVAWSSYSSNALDGLSTHNTGHSLALLQSILVNEDVCDHDAIVLVSQPGLHASDLRTLSPSSMLARSLSSSPSSRQFQYVPSHPELDISAVAESVSVRCGSRIVEFSPGQGGYFSRGTKHVFSISMPNIETSGAVRKSQMKTYGTKQRSESQLADELSHLASSFPNHLIIYTGSSSSSTLSKRQAPPPPAPSRPVLENIFQANTTLPDGGILKRYQLLTPGLIMALLVAFFILLPVAMIGFSALASIQSPLRVEPPRGYSATEKKSQ
ncbi:hypothetical protein L208DRAFT_1428746, partial [Tricholoma matsutake]